MDVLAQLIRPVANSLNLSTLPLHIHHVVAAFLLYEGTFHVLSPLISTYIFFPRSYARLDRRTRINWHTHVVSMVQALLINGMALSVMFTDPERNKANEDWRERLWGYTPRTGMVQGFAAGYFLWDLVVSVEHFDILGASSLLHAVAALGITLLGFVSCFFFG
jgi:hypothetical protein